MMKKAKSHMKAYFFDPNDPTSIIRLLPTLKLACDADNILESAAT